MKRRAVLLALLASPAMALDPSEMLEDAGLEARARALDHEIRCVKCQSEAIASSNAQWAQDARRTVRELIAGGATDREVKDWFLERYGEFVLMNPDASGANLALWLAGPVMGAVGIIGALAYLRGRAKPEPTKGLSADEQARLDEILKE